MLTSSSTPSNESSLRWKIKPLQLPRPLRPCSRCHQIRPFRCSELFRVNGHQHRLDVWLIYRCEHCESTWNFKIFHRAKPEQIGERALPLYETSDRELVWRHAFDLKALTQTGARIEPSLRFEVEGPDRDFFASQQERCSVLLELEVPLALRLDQLLSHKLELSRKQIKAALQRGALRLFPECRRPWRQQIADGQVIVFDCGEGKLGLSEEKKTNILVRP